MIDELFLYDRDKGLFKEILKQSKMMQGRYHVSPNYGHDLNTNNLESFIKDEAYGLSIPTQKYPLTVCMMPASRFVLLNSQKWEQLFFVIYFLCTAETDGKNQIKKLDKDTNTSGQHTWYDWSDMKQCAADFMEQLKLVIKKKNVGNIPLKSVLNIDFDRANIVRLTKFNNDKLNGVGVTLSAYMFTDACTLKDYDNTALENINIPSFTIP